MLQTKAKKKILLLSDDLRLHSGIATMSREIVLNTAHEFDWVQLGAALNHPDNGKVFDVSEDLAKQANINSASVKIYCFSGYGNPEVIRELISIEKPDAIMIFTDPRFWDWFFKMEHEIRQFMPIIYYNIWDCDPPPMWNGPAYESCDLLMNISKQTQALVNEVLEQRNNVEVEKITF